jgi:hypothetical protein
MMHSKLLWGRHACSSGCTFCELGGAIGAAVSAMLIASLGGAKVRLWYTCCRFRGRIGAVVWTRPPTHQPTNPALCSF